MKQAKQKPKQKRAPRRVETEMSKLTLRIFQHASSGIWWVDLPPEYSDTGKRKRESLHTTDYATAYRQTQRRIEKLTLGMLEPDTKASEVTIAQLFAAYERHRLPHLSATRQRTMRALLRRFGAAWEPSRRVASLCQTDIDQYCADRRTAHVLHHERVYRRDHPKATTVPSIPPLRDGILANDLRALTSVLNWAIDQHKLPDGKPLLDKNPLLKLKKPHEPNPRRPRTSEQRYQQTLAVTDEIDPLGRLRLMLVLAHDKARRISAICNARRSAFLLSAEAMRVAGLSEDRIQHSPHGVIAWAGEFDKQRKQRYTPIAPWTRVEIDRYLAKHALVGNAPMFPGHRTTRPGGRPDPLGPRPETRPITRRVASNLLLAAEQRAGLAKLDGGVWHPYRRLWAASHRDLADQRGVARAGGWDSLKVMQDCYQGDAEAASDYDVMCYRPPAPSSAAG